VGSGPVVADPNDDSEVALDEDVSYDPDELLSEAMGNEDVDAATLEELSLVAKSLGGKIGTQLRIFDEADFSQAAKDAGADADSSMAEGFFLGKDNTIYINRSMLRRGLGAHEGTHAVVFAALSGHPRGQRIIADAASQAMRASPESAKVITEFLKGYGGAKMLADGTIDVEATAADTVLSHEVVAEFVAGIYNGTIKLDGSVKRFLRDLYNRVMAALGVSTEFNPRTDADFVAMAKQLASAMKAGRTVSVKNAQATAKQEAARADSFRRKLSAEPTPGREDIRKPLDKKNDDFFDSGFGGIDGNPLTPFSIRRASDLARSMEVSSTQAEATDPSSWPFSRRQPDGSLNNLPRKFKAGGKEMEASHWQPAEDVAISYMEKAGLPYNPPSDYVKVDPARAKRIADAYEAMKHDPENPEVKEAYEALAKETIAQYEEVLGSGLKVEFIPPGSPDPYTASPRLATEDIRNNNHMWVFGTRDGFGSSDFDPSSNPLLEESGFEISGQPALVNDLFRVVHDYFGHVKEGLGFRADGEENAWRMHSSMFSPKAQRALTTETRGQNSWVNFGPHGEKNRTASGSDTVYADQKTGLLPMWVSEDGRNDSVNEADKPKFSKATHGKNIVPAKHRDNLTDDGKGNYVFFHKGPKNLKGGKINPAYFGSGKTKDNRSNPVMNYYTKPDQGERMITGDVTYAVPVPKWKVYPLMSDPLDLYDKAEANFRKKFGKDQAFDAVRQADFIGPLAEKAGFDIMIAGWSVHPLRAESGKALKPDMALTKKYEDEGVVDLTAVKDPYYEKLMAKARGEVKFSSASPQNIAKALIAKGYNTKAKARAYMLSKGADRMVDQVMAEFDKLRDAAAKKAVPPAQQKPDGDGVKKTFAGRRVYEGAFRDEVREEVRRLGLFREVESRAEAREKAKKLIESVGIDAAVDAVRNKDMEGGAAAFVWDEALRQLDTQILESTDPTTHQELVAKQRADGSGDRRHAACCRSLQLRMGRHPEELRPWIPFREEGQGVGGQVRRAPIQGDHGRVAQA
jgi:hypothetical protein